MITKYVTLSRENEKIMYISKINPNKEN